MAEEEMRKLNFVINDGDAFFTNEMSITFGPAQFAFDFKNISPRVDMRNQDDTKTFVMKHNVILIEPFQIKQFAKVLNECNDEGTWTKMQFSIGLLNQMT